MVYALFSTAPLLYVLYHPLSRVRLLRKTELARTCDGKFSTSADMRTFNCTIVTKMSHVHTQVTTSHKPAKCLPGSHERRVSAQWRQCSAHGSAHSTRTNPVAIHREEQAHSAHDTRARLAGTRQLDRRELQNFQSAKGSDVPGPWLSALRQPGDPGRDTTLPRQRE